MRLYLVIDDDRWGHSHTVVRAASDDDASAVAAPNSRSAVYVLELPPDGPPGVLWCWYDSPDSVRD